MVGNYPHCIEEASDRHAFPITIYLFILQRILTFALSLYKTILKSIGLVSATSFTFKDALFCSKVFCFIFTPGLIVYTTNWCPAMPRCWAMQGKCKFIQNSKRLWSPWGSNKYKYRFIMADRPTKYIIYCNTTIRVGIKCEKSHHQRKDVKRAEKMRKEKSFMR